ncbi:phenylalanine--tRNA ligase subunit beta [Micromonospora sp. CPCC 205546]|uniref:phenylalanine--tRNA ligase subunit beta n=1 Tax=Micromonospora sp. CPCC 205546 TaxID=3122397 RepID=UPI002FF2BAD9
MRISLDWIRDYVDLPTTVDVKELAHVLTLKTVEVERWIDTGERLAHVVVASVTDVQPLGTRGVSLTCDVGTGQAVSVVSRVAGVTAGRVLALALPGARLAARGEGEQQAETVAVREVFGVLSHGVLVSPADVGLQNLFPEPGDGLLDCAELEVPPGTPLATAVGFDDWVLEIDNKSLTNRPDLWGHYGMAREIATIHGLPLKALPGHASPPLTDGLVGAVDPALCRRFTAVRFAVDRLPPTPMWLRSRLARVGESPRNLCVDLSNYVMHAVGQPNHVYDAGRVALPLSVRAVESRTRLDLLAGHTREVEPGTPVVADADGPVGLAGIIGGAGSGVGPDSRTFVLETANFDPRAVRRASQRTGLRTEASSRYEKNLDTPRIDAAVGFFLHLLTGAADAVRLDGMQDVTHVATERAVVTTSLDFLSARIGERLGVAEVRDALTPLGFEVVGADGRLTATAPPWRSTGDISLPHDIAEEVARIRGYENIPSAGLTVTLNPVRQLNARPVDRVLREQLVRAGMREVISYPWTADSLLLATGHAKADTVRLVGAPAPDRESLRPSLVPNLVETVAANLRHQPEFGIFEVGTAFRARPPGDAGDDPEDEHLPEQRRLLAAAFVGADGPTLFRRAKGVLEFLTQRAQLADTDLDPVSDPAAQRDSWADRSACLAIVSAGRRAGTLGLVTTRVRRAAGIAGQVAVFELDVDVLSTYTSRHNVHQRVPDHPDADFDLSLVVAETVRWRDLVTTARRVDPCVHDVAYVDEFRGSWVPAGHRSLSLRITVRSAERTPTADDIGRARQRVLDELAARHGAHLRVV